MFILGMAEDFDGLNMALICTYNTYQEAYDYMWECFMSELDQWGLGLDSDGVEYGDFHARIEGWRKGVYQGGTLFRIFNNETDCTD